ncbi:MAG: imidazoleglycerol-phosphate dehydratase HisB [Elusimicrobiota bacterium]|jgi:imidazoleglycerol-phosphate dehydratase
MKRQARITRQTRETQIDLTLNLDGTGKASIQTPIAFLNHMFELFAKHGRFDLKIRAKGDTQIDDHHLVEDLGLVLGEAIAKALGNKKGICRYGNYLLPMDETLSYVALDLSNRPFFVWKVKWGQSQIGRFNGLLLEHFFESVAASARMNLHMALKYGKHAHHIGESLFKGFARALAQAVSIDPRVKGIPSTKGKL